MNDLIIFSGQNSLFFLVILFIAGAALIAVRRLLKVSFPYFFIGLVGLIVGSIIGALLSSPLSKLPGEYGRWLPLIANVFITVSIFDLFLAQSLPVAKFFQKITGRMSADEKNEIADEIMIDTSVLIDGRIEAIAHTGFIMGRLLVPQFILNELQNIADSEDSLKRAKGRKGLDILDHLRHSNEIQISIIDEMTNGRETVDSKLLKVARIRHAKVLTIDFNLNKVAKIQNIEVLNINELTEAIKPVLIPGEDVLVKVTQEGKEENQGVGYLTDGTMMVVEGGAKYIGQEIDCEVVRIFQTMAGKMIFVQPKKVNRIKSKRALN